MANDMTGQALPSLRVGTILGDTFSLIFRNFRSMMMIGLIPAILGVCANLMAYGAATVNTLDGLVGPSVLSEAMLDMNAGTPVVMLFVGVLLWGLGAATMTAAAYDAVCERPVRLRRAIRTGVAQLHWVIICMTLTAIAVYAGLIVVLLPGLYLTALWLVIVPAMVVEKAGIGCFGRSMRLTRHYRWPLVGLVILFALVSLVIGVLSLFVQALLALMGSAGFVMALIWQTTLGAFFYALVGGMIALTYARLVEVKEGTSVSNLADIFS